MLENDDASFKAAKNTIRRYINVPTGLTREQLACVDELAAREQCTRSEIIREAVQKLVVDKMQSLYEQREDILIRELQRVEKGLRALTVKGVRLNAQALYFASLPFHLGPPRAALSKESYMNQYEKSLGFAAMVLKSGGRPDQIDVTSEQNDGEEQIAS
jgi:hypothetical protein